MPIHTTAQGIKKLLEDSMIYGVTGNITINLNNVSVIIKQNDIIGNALQEWLGSFLDSKDVYYRPAIGQTFPDLYLGDTDNQSLCEVKTFRDEAGPAFDIANFLGYINSVRAKPYRLDSDYLIMSYANDDNGQIKIKNIWCKKVWEISGPALEYPLNCQRKNGQIVNIRPIRWMSTRPNVIKPFNTKEEFLIALYKTYKEHTNQIRVARAWLDEVIAGYAEYSGNDMRTAILSNLTR